MTPEQVKLNAFLEKEKIELTYQLTFPMYQILPDEVKLAIYIIHKHGLKISVTPTPRQDKK